MSKVRVEAFAIWSIKSKNIVSIYPYGGRGFYTKTQARNEAKTKIGIFPRWKIKKAIITIEV